MANSGNHSINWMFVASAALIILGILIIVEKPFSNEEDSTSQKEDSENNTEVAYVVSKPDGSINGYGYVDLGLPSGLKWAWSNIGADSPEEFGNYFQWGRVTPRERYDSLKTKDKFPSPYNKDVAWLLKNDFIGSNGQLTSSHDAARQNMGGSWRMPTKEEMEELISNTTAAWGNLNGVDGCFVKSNKNGKIIFLPATRSRFNHLHEKEAYGEYWSSTPYIKDAEFSVYLYFGLYYNDPKDIMLIDPEGKYNIPVGEGLDFKTNNDTRGVLLSVRAVSE